MEQKRDAKIVTLNFLVHFLLQIFIYPHKVQTLTQITNCTGLQSMANDLQESYYLQCNISCANVTDFVPVGNSMHPFQGKFDGMGHTISCLTINNTSLSNVGIFGFCQNANLSNVVLESLNVMGNSCVGALVGNGMQTNISNVQLNNVTVYADNNYVGGIAGYLKNSQIVQCSSQNSFISGSNNSGYCGGLIGRLFYSNMTNCTNFGFPANKNECIVLCEALIFKKSIFHCKPKKNKGHNLAGGLMGGTDYSYLLQSGVILGNVTALQSCAGGKKLVKNLYSNLYLLSK